MPSASEPASIEEAEALVAAASAAGQRVSIEREGGDVIVSTRRLDRVVEHAAGDLTATVEAGIRLSQLDAALAVHGQMLALDPPGDPTVGACVAGNLSGPRRHRYGTARDLVLGVTLVLAEGTRANAGGKVVKNVAGYDLGKLCCGSRGTLGLIVRVSLRLHPRPRTARTLVAPAETPAEAWRLTRELHHSTLVPSAVDLLWQTETLQQTVAKRPGRLALLLEGNEAAVEAQLGVAQALLGGHQDAEVWDEVAERQQRAAGRVSFPPGELGGVLARLPEAIVRVGAGVAHVPEPVAAIDDAPVRRLHERIRQQFDPGGVFVAT